MSRICSAGQQNTIGYGHVASCCCWSSSGCSFPQLCSPAGSPVGHKNKSGTCQNSKVNCRSRLQWGAADWPQEGRPDSRGALLGGEVILRLDLISAFQVGISSSLSADFTAERVMVCCLSAGLLTTLLQASCRKL